MSHISMLSVSLSKLKDYQADEKSMDLLCTEYKATTSVQDGHNTKQEGTIASLRPAV